ncbi:MAG: hypothetical protein ACRDHZ_26530, partial [Ktedonobacteraceae bacterium]
MQESFGQRFVQANILPPNAHDIDWSAAPLHFKLYSNCEQIACTYRAVEQRASDTPEHLTRELVGRILADIYGLTRQNHRIGQGLSPQQADSLKTSSVTEDVKQAPLTSAFALLRPVPSGGALFPCEIYLLIGQGEDFSPGLYHYDAAHHALDILRQNDYSPILGNYLAHLA